MNLNSYQLNYPYSVNFCAMKKNQFHGIDRACVDKFAPPIETFNSIDNLQTWAKNKKDELIKPDYPARNPEGSYQRRKILKEWNTYITTENQEYTPVMCLMIMSTITKNLKRNNDKLPPILNKGVLANTIEEVKDLEEFNLEKIYTTKLHEHYTDSNNTDETQTGWIIIPSKKNSPEDFEKNVEKLKTLSHRNWCTKGYNAKPYLEKGDFHIYLENGKPKLGLRFLNDEVEEIQGESNDGKLPIKYYDLFKSYQEEQNLNLSYATNVGIEQTEKIKEHIKNIKTNLDTAIELNTIEDAEKIFNYFGIANKKTDDGLKLKEYSQPFENISYEDIGIDENKLFEYINEIEGNIIFNNTNLTNLGNLKKIGGYADFAGSKVNNLGELKYIYGSANFKESQITTLNNLEYIRGNASFWKSQITSLGELKEIGDGAIFRDSKIRDLGKLEKIGGSVTFSNSQITSLKNLQSIGGTADFKNSLITSFDNVKSIGGSVYLEDAKINDFGKLQSINGNLYIKHSPLEHIKDINNYLTSKNIIVNGEIRV